MYTLTLVFSLQKVYFFINGSKNLTLSLATHRRFSLKSADFPYDIRVQRSLNFGIVTTILISTQQQGRDFVTSFRPRDLSMASDKPFNYHFGLWVLSRAKPTPENDRNEDIELDNRLAKNAFRLPCQGCQVSRRLSSRQLNWTE